MGSTSDRQATRLGSLVFHIDCDGDRLVRLHLCWTHSHGGYNEWLDRLANFDSFVKTPRQAGARQG